MLTCVSASAVTAATDGTPFTLYQGDWRDVLSDLPEGSVSLIVSSPPYFLGKEYDRSTRHEDFVREHLELAPLLSRVLRPGGSLCWQTGMHVSDATVLPLDFLTYDIFSREPSLYLRNRIIWHFEHGVHAKNRFSGRHETILWFTKGKNYTFNLDAVRVPQKYPGKRHYKGPKKGTLSGNPAGKNPGDMWSIPNVKAKHKEKMGHPCQFPIGLPQRLVRALTNPGDLVLDPFAGVASAGIAATLEGRRFLGCEVEAKYAKLAGQRYRKMLAGTLPIRDWKRPIDLPNPRQAVAKVPPHFWRHGNEIGWVPLDSGPTNGSG